MSTAEALPMSSAADISGLAGDGSENEAGRDSANSSDVATRLRPSTCLV